MFFATLFDANYAPRATVFYNSLRAVMKDTEEWCLFILALDEGVVQAFSQTPHTKVIPLSDLTSYFPELHAARSNRNYVEFIFTLSPYLPLYILEHYSHVDRITTMDADLYFLDSPAAVLSSLGKSGIGITPHHFSESFAYLEKFGKFNVSFQSFPATETGLNCLRQWAADCLNSCQDDKGSEVYADQKYLDKWPAQYPEVTIFPGGIVGLAPWNLSHLAQKISPQFTIDGKPIVFYHFHDFRYRSKNAITLGLHKYHYALQHQPIRKLYKQYFRQLDQLENRDKGLTRGKYAGKSLIQKLYTYLSEGPVLFHFADRVLMFRSLGLYRLAYRLKKTLNG